MTVNSSIHCALSLAAQCIVIGPVCLFATGGRAGGVRTLLQPARAQCLCLSERTLYTKLKCATGFVFSRGILLLYTWCIWWKDAK